MTCVDSLITLASFRFHTLIIVEIPGNNWEAVPDKR